MEEEVLVDSFFVIRLAVYYGGRLGRWMRRMGKREEGEGGHSAYLEEARDDGTNC